MIELFSALVRGNRIKKGWSIRETAKLADMSWRNFVRIENGEVTPHLDKALRLAKLLGIKLDKL